jgi:hypothetical protein
LNKFGSNVPYLGEDGYYSYNGTVSVPIGANRFDKTFFELVDNSYLSNISSAVDPITKNFFWAWPDGSATDGVPNWLLSWNWSTNRATLIEVSGGCEFLFRAGAFGSTLEDLDALGFTLETLPFSLDSRFWTGGRSLLAMFNSSHELCFFTGSALQADYETGEPDGGMGNMMHVSGVRPLVDAANLSGVSRRSRRQCELYQHVIPGRRWGVLSASLRQIRPREDHGSRRRDVDAHFRL